MNARSASLKAVHPQQGPKRSPWLRIIGCPVIALLVILSVLGVSWWLRQREIGANRATAIQANNRGIVFMEQFRIHDAIPHFEEAVRLAPHWLPGRINLGIALLCESGGGDVETRRCQAVFDEVLLRDPDNPHAHFCLGLLLLYKKDRRQAVDHFEAVLRQDPSDAYSWYWLGTLKEDSDEETECHRQALKRNRHLSGAIYGLARNIRGKEPEVAEALFEELEALKKVDWQTNATLQYGEMGRYAEVIGDLADPHSKPRIGPLPRFLARSLKVQLAAGARWATPADFGADAVAEVRRLVRARFGATMVVLDYNRDGRLDLFLAGAVRENGQVRDLLLRNDGDGQLTDATAAAGLAEPRPTLGCVVADFDNDRWPDLLLTGAGVQKLFRNTGTGKFEDVTAKAGLDKLTSVCLGASFLDLNHDGNLDMLICEYAATAPQALAALRGEKTTGGLAVFLNVGTAPQVEPKETRPALTCAFRQTRDVPGIKEETRGLTNLAVCDFDGDGDLDVMIFADHDHPTLLRNDRLLRFHRQPFDPVGIWNGAVALDAFRNGHSCLYLLEPRQGLLQQYDRGELTGIDGRLLSIDGSIMLPTRQAVAADIDLDSWIDIVALSEDNKPSLLHNEGGGLIWKEDGLGNDLPGDVASLAVCDLNGDDNPDVIIWSESRGLQLLENQGNGNYGLSLELLCTKQRDPGSGNRVCCSADGFGTRVTIHAGAMSVSHELATVSAALGQSRQPLLLGLGPAPRADVIRLRWPDGTRQAERAFLTGQRNFIEWQQRKMTGW